MVATNYNNNTFTDALPPCSLDAEEQLLGAILLQPELLELIKHLPTEAFYLSSHQKIFRCFLQLEKKGKNPDLMQVRSYLSDKGQLDAIGGIAKLAQIADRCVGTYGIKDNADLIIQKWIRRRGIEIGQKMAQSGYESPADLDSLLDAWENQILEITQSPFRNKRDPEYAKYEKLIERVRKCELECRDPGFKDFTMQAIAKEYGRNPKQIQSIYFRHLIHTEQEPLMNLEQLIEKYGSEVREWLMHGFIPKGSTILLHAPGGKGKTRLAYNFFYHLATGSHWDGFPVTAPKRKCMIIQTDEPGYDMVQAVRDRGFENDMPVLYRTKWQTDHMAYLREEIERERPDIVLLDSLSSINRNSIFTENDAEYARPILLLRDIAQEFNCTFMIIHHSSKNGDARGTGAIFNSVSEVWKLESDPDSPAPDSTDRIFTIEKSRTRRPARYKLEFNPDDKSWSCLGEHDHIKKIEDDRELEGRLNLKDRVAAFLVNNAPTRFECEEIANEVGGSLGAVRRACGDLAADAVCSSTRSPRDARKKIYWVGREDDGGEKCDPRSDPKSDPIGSDQIAIGSDDQILSPENEDSSRSDHLIIKNEQKSDRESDQKSDPIGSDDQIDPKPPSEKDSRSDRKSDRQSDPSRSDQIGSDQEDQKFKVGDRVSCPNGLLATVVDFLKERNQIKIKFDKGGSGFYEIDQVEKQELPPNLRPADPQPVASTDYQQGEIFKPGRYCFEGEKLLWIQSIWYKKSGKFHPDDGFRVWDVNEADQAIGRRHDTCRFALTPAENINGEWRPKKEE